ncbi:hypothetical protein [Cohnella nanjingensis]|uniref:Zinc ribbon domain-containing protein n=1 Tax=Cohnella nanjingensis TaxID=1387779 RepID=A0A7X0RKQ2_9BACL|nr:hypothetical protein [Cohnella nanjingensis]MBB6669242.1 hypothetical protein [Cohnella nanjingensis]
MAVFTVLVGIIAVILFFVIWHSVIQSAIDNSELAKTLKSIQTLLEQRQPPGMTHPSQVREWQSRRSSEDGGRDATEEVFEDEGCPGCGTLVSVERISCPECGLTLRDDS